MVDAEDGRDLPPRVASISELHLDGFDGPMDLLLDLVERQRFDLGRVPVPDLVEQRVLAMDRLVGRMVPKRQAEWLVLPASPVEAQDVGQDAAREKLRLMERLRMRAVAAWLEARPQLGRATFACPLRQKEGRSETTMALMEACLAALRRLSNRSEAATGLPAGAGPAVAGRAGAGADPPDAGGGSGGWGACIFPAGGGAGADRLRQARGAVAGTFVACLELARQGEVTAEQEGSSDRSGSGCHGWDRCSGSYR